MQHMLRSNFPSASPKCTIFGGGGLVKCDIYHNDDELIMRCSGTALKQRMHQLKRVILWDSFTENHISRDSYY